MEELISVMADILSELKAANEKLDGIRERLDDVVGPGADDSLSDVCVKLDRISGALDAEKLAEYIKRLDQRIEQIERGIVT